MTDMFLVCNGTKLFYTTMGSGPPLLMVHGNGESHEIFDTLAEALRVRFTLYLPDLRGHGQSAPCTEYHYQTMADDLAAFCDALHLHQPVFFGFSDGGILGLLLASQHPALFSRLIVCGANTQPNGIKRRWLAAFRLSFLASRDPKLKMMLYEPDIPASALARIQTPTLVLAGSRDMIRRAHTKALALSLPNSRLQILAGETHSSYIVHSSKLADQILRFCP